MRREERYVTELAHALLASCETDPPPADLDVDRLIESLVSTRILATLGPTLLRGPASDTLRNRVEAELRPSKRAAVLFWLEVSRVCQILKECGVDFALLKGPALAMTFYPTPAQRQSGDIDVLVPPEQLEDACDALRRADHEFDHTDVSATLYKTHHFHWLLRAPTGIRVEVHWALSAPRHYYRYDVTDIFKRAKVLQLSQVSVQVPSDADQVLHAAGQAALDGFLDLRRTLDAALLLDRGDVDPQYLCDVACRQGLATAVWGLARQAAELTGVEVARLITDRLRPAAGKRIGLETLVSLERVLGSRPKNRSAALSRVLCAPGFRSFARVLWDALIPGPDQYLGHDGTRTEPHRVHRRAWIALRTVERLIRQACLLAWQRLRHGFGR